jgi:electron transfer flavoprotein beta subunit
MTILVCVKEVPGTEAVAIDVQNHRLKRDSAEGILNPFDGFALELALELKVQTGAAIWLLCMGPQSAAATLRHCLSVGADHAIHVCDRDFAGSDSLITASILSQSIRYLENSALLHPDLILCGKQAIDGDTAQVGPALAEKLGIPQVTSAYQIEKNGRFLDILAENDEGRVRYAIADAPVLVTVMKTTCDLRLPTIAGKLNARKAKIMTISNQDLRLEPAVIGLEGSPTRVLKSAPVKYQKQCRTVKAETPGAAKALLDFLQEKNIFGS